MIVITEHPNQQQLDARWTALVRGTLYDVLPPAEQRAVRMVNVRYPLTVQEMRLLCEAARDLEMWGEPGLADWWQQAETQDAAPQQTASAQHQSPGSAADPQAAASAAPR